MKPAAEAATKALAGSRPSSASDSRATSTLMDFLWGRMTEIYGHRWESSYGSKPTETWSRALSALSKDELKRALSACLKRADPWPPSLPEFIAMARPPKRENAAAYRFQALPTAPKSSSERAASELANLRRMLGGR